ncbi:hypothetical protein ACS0TY_009916 [Phlomoides rotata]
MGTKVHSKSYLPGYYSMRDLNEDSSSSSWPVCYGDKAITNGQYYNGFTPSSIMDGYPGCGKDALKQKMLEHEAVFRNQVYELHRLYRIQRDLMEEVKRKELNGIRASMEPSSSSSLRGSHVPSEDAQKWHMEGFPLLNSGYKRTSVSGVEIIDSPMSCTKGYNAQPGQFPFPNGSSLKDSKLLDSRPLKVRKKLFDLELPADEYVDIEDDKNLPEGKVSDALNYVPNGKLKSGPESRVAEPASASCLADLNEPVEIEEAIAPSSTNFFGHISNNGETKGVNLPSNGGYFGVREETKHQRDEFLINSSIESKFSERGRLSHIYGTGSISKSYLNSATHGHLQDKLPIPSHYPVQGMLNRSDHHLGIYPTAHSKEELWRNRNHHGLESSDKSRNQSNNRHLEASEAPRSDPFFNSYFSGSWAHPVSSWAKPTSSFTQKLTTLESCSNSAADRGETNGGKWRVGDSSRLNGFYHGSASGSKELKVHSSSGSADYLNRSRGENVASNRATNHGFGHFMKGSCRGDAKSMIDINLNEVVAKSSSNEAVIMHDDDVIVIDGKDSKPEDHLSALPWLRNKPARASSNWLSCKNEKVTDLNQPPRVILTSSEMKTEVSENQNVKKILGVPIFETGASNSDGNSINKEIKKILIDINLEYEPEDQIASEEPSVEKEKQTYGVSGRDYIDLNSCVTDCEDALAPSYESKTENVKAVLDINLESPAVLEEDENKVETKQESESLLDEVLRNAAESIVAISSSCPGIHTDITTSDSLEASAQESLLWFVDTVSLFEEQCKNTSGNNQGEEMDDFEARTLQIPLTKEEDYMPAPFVPEHLNVEESTLPARPRRVQSKRGRQRRDFQRDILPGLASLSRNEVTEDIQMFSGLMRATGHHNWISGLTRRNGTRNGGGRGRRRAVVENVATATPNPVCTTTPLMQQLSGIEGGLEDRSLTGWGKTTRRPRRQRCPPPAAVVLT